MRNTLKYPITKQEVLDVLGQLEYKDTTEIPCGSLKPMIVEKLKEVVEKTWDTKIWSQGLYESHFEGK